MLMATAVIPQIIISLPVKPTVTAVLKYPPKLPLKNQVSLILPKVPVIRQVALLLADFFLNTKKAG
jgi:hypothetical protein